MNGLKAHSIKKRHQVSIQHKHHKVSISALIEDYIFNSPEIVHLLEAFRNKSNNYSDSQMVIYI